MLLHWWPHVSWKSRKLKNTKNENVNINKNHTWKIPSLEWYFFWSRTIFLRWTLFYETPLNCCRGKWIYTKNMKISSAIAKIMIYDKGFMADKNYGLWDSKRSHSFPQIFWKEIILFGLLYFSQYLLQFTTTSKRGRWPMAAPPPWKLPQWPEVFNRYNGNSALAFSDHFF